MRIPIVMPAVDIQIGHDGHLRVTVDGRPYGVDQVMARSEVRQLVDRIATEIGTAVRVEIHEADGTTYTDIATPPPPQTPAPATGEVTPETAPALAGAGFHPGEQVALAYVVSHQTADDAGVATVNLPPALARLTRDGLVLLGLTSQTVTPLTPSRASA